MQRAATKFATFDSLISSWFRKLFIWPIHGFHGLMLFAHLLEGSNWPLDFIIELFEGVGLSLRAIIIDEIGLFVSFLWITSWLLWKFQSGLTLSNSMNFKIKIWWATFPWNLIYRALVGSFSSNMLCDLWMWDFNIYYFSSSFVFRIDQLPSSFDSLLGAHWALAMTSPGHITFASLTLPSQVLARCRLQNTLISFRIALTWILILISTCASIMLIKSLIIGGSCCFVYNT